MFHPNWKILASADISWKQFVKEGLARNDGHDKVRVSGIGNQLSGEEVKQAYEEVINLPTQVIKNTRKNAKIPKTYQEPCSSTSENQNKPKDKYHWINTLMKEASRNNVQGVSNMLCDISELNITDQFGWTMLMCAAHAGAVDVVQYLVNNGADVDIIDKSGNTAMSLAKRQGHASAVEIIKSYPQVTEQITVNTNNINYLCEFYCEICKLTFKDSSRKQHNSSTVHLFNCHPRSYQTFYSIPENNKGYQLLVKGGWDKEKGLGPAGSGHKFPLKTVLKRDRKGLGSYKGEPRVTHFAPLALEAVRVERRVLGKRHREAKIDKERRKERALRHLGLLENPQYSLRYLSEVEELGEEILTDRQEIVALDRRRNHNREGVRALTNASPVEKTWLALGSLLIKLPKEKTISMLKKDQVQLDIEINKLRSELKLKVNKLRDLEHLPPVPGLMLNALSSKEATAIKKAMGVNR